MSNKIVELDITDLAFDGKSVGHYEGKVVFVNGGLPGEKIRARITKSKPRYLNAVLDEILTHSDLRIDTRCEHFGICGGCTWQDLEYQQQLKFKHKQVIDCLQRLGKLEDVDVPEVIGSAEQFHYRNKMEFSTHVTEENERGFTMGLHHRGRYDEIFDLKQCWLQAPSADRVVTWVRQFIADKGIPIYDVKNHVGFIRFLMIRRGQLTGDLMVNLVTNYGEMPHRQEFIDGLTAACPEITTIVRNQNGQKSNIAVGEIEEVLFGRGFIEEKLFDSKFRISANSFFQTNSKQAQVLYQTIFDMIDPQPTDRVLDLYCGTGTIGIILAPRVGEVLGIELVADAIIAARTNASENGVPNISFIEGNVKDVLKEKGEEPGSFDVIIVDPPRAGMHPKALKQLIALRPPKLAYISCNPSTFARDARELVNAGYRLPEVKPVDMFPHTMHIELAAMFFADKADLADKADKADQAD